MTDEEFESSERTIQLRHLEHLEKRLTDAGIRVADFAELIWRYLGPRIEEKILRIADPTIKDRIEQIADQRINEMFRKVWFSWGVRGDDNFVGDSHDLR